MDWLLIIILVLSFFLGWYISGLINKKCSHSRMIIRFVDLHTGADSEMYVRASNECPDCGYKRSIAVRLPEWIDVALDRKKLD